MIAFHLCVTLHITSVLKRCALFLWCPGLIFCACPCSTRGSGESLSPSPLIPDPVPTPGQTCCCVEEVRVSTPLMFLSREALVVITLHHVLSVN